MGIIPSIKSNLIRIVINMLLIERSVTGVLFSLHRQSMEELVRNQTDWLKEFRQTVPLSSQLRSNISSASSVPPPPPPTTLHVAPVHGHLGSQSLLPSRPRLILDKSNNIQLVHL